MDSFFVNLALAKMPEHLTFLGIFFFVFIIGFFLIPEELILILVGYVAAATGIGLTKSVIASALAIIAIDNFWFFIGHKEGRLYDWIKKKLGTEKIEKYESFITHHAEKYAFLIRFMFGMRIPLLFLAGSMRINKKKFWIWNTLSGTIYAALGVLIGYLAKDHINAILKDSRLAMIFLAIIIIAISAVLFVEYKNPRKK